MSRTMSRRQFVRAGAGVAALTYVGGVSNAFGGGFNAFGLAAGGHPTIQPHLLGVQHFSVRDATARLSIASSTRLGVTPTMGRLGGPGLPRGSDRPRAAGAAARWLCGSVRLPRLGGRQRLRVLPVDAERQRARPAAHRGRDPLVSRQRRPRRTGDAPVRPGQPRRSDGQPHRADPAAPRRRRREPVRLPADARHEDDGLLGQPLVARHTRKLRQPRRPGRSRTGSPPARSTSTGSARSSGIATSSTSSTRSRTTTASSTTPLIPSWTPCTASSG